MNLNCFRFSNQSDSSDEEEEWLYCEDGGFPSGYITKPRRKIKIINGAKEQPKPVKKEGPFLGLFFIPKHEDSEASSSDDEKSKHKKCSGKKNNIKSSGKSDDNSSNNDESCTGKTLGLLQNNCKMPRFIKIWPGRPSTSSTSVTPTDKSSSKLNLNPFKSSSNPLPTTLFLPVGGNTLKPQKYDKTKYAPKPLARRTYRCNQAGSGNNSSMMQPDDKPGSSHGNTQHHHHQQRGLITGHPKTGHCSGSTTVRNVGQMPGPAVQPRNVVPGLAFNPAAWGPNTGNNRRRRSSSRSSNS